MNGVVAVADEIAPMLLCRPQVVGLAGIAFAVLIGLVLALRLRVAPADPRAAGVWLTQAGSRWSVRAALGVLPFRGILFRWLIRAVRA